MVITEERISEKREALQEAKALIPPVTKKGKSGKFNHKYINLKHDIANVIKETKIFKETRAKESIDIRSTNYYNYYY